MRPAVLSFGAAVPVPATSPVRHGSATFDRTRRYRYSLTRVWAAERGTVVFVGLNPNRADAVRDDPTIRRCLGFARRWGFGALEVVNLFARCAPTPRALRDAAHPVGPDNDVFLRDATGAAALVVAAWGAHGTLHERDAAVRGLLRDATVPVVCLGRTAGGQPRHPLYLRADTAPRPFS